MCAWQVIIASISSGSSEPVSPEARQPAGQGMKQGGAPCAWLLAWEWGPSRRPRPQGPRKRMKSMPKADQTGFQTPEESMGRKGGSEPRVPSAPTPSFHVGFGPREPSSVLCPYMEGTPGQLSLFSLCLLIWVLQQNRTKRRQIHTHMYIMYIMTHLFVYY